jgi:hypothetical protein
MNIKTTLKTAKNLFNDGFVVSHVSLGRAYNVLTGETQYPPRDVIEVLDFLCNFKKELREKTSTLLN